ncbi:MAG: two-component regulator propeller domain-containing protein [Candidatus Marinimicrobia bacterium]|nr:two-component regulator propeller domain-containing protein [Candidatus Neomarinimicrobiota bacterium]
MILFKYPLFIITLSYLAFSQPENRFLPFDWVQYRQTGKINSISFSNRYAYIGTQLGGVQRFNLLSNRFEEPITRAQGLRSNSINAVHRASNGVLWVGSSYGIEYSLSEEGDWTSINRDFLGLPFGETIYRIGESDQDIWLETSTLFYRLDPITGLVTGRMSNPNVSVLWSSGLIRFQIDLSNLLFEYSISNGWMTDFRSLISPNGKQMRVTTIATSIRDEIWLGTEDGTFFIGDNTMKTFSPFRFTLANNDIQYIEGKDSFWLGGRLNQYSSGVTYFDIDRSICDVFTFNENINMDRNSIYSIIKLNDEIWFGGEDGIIVYNTKKDFWRTFNVNIGTNKPLINSFLKINNEIWLATNNGIVILNKNNKSRINNEIVDYFNNNIIYDLSNTENHIFITTEVGLYIYDNNNNKIYDLESFGYKTKNFILPSNHFDYTAITKDEKYMYFANQSGIIVFNFKDRSWSNAVESSIYGSQEVKSIAIDKEKIFIATINGVVEFDMNNNTLEIYNYKFFGSINDIYIKGKKIWLGTSEGLISYRYK